MTTFSVILMLPLWDIRLLSSLKITQTLSSVLSILSVEFLLTLLSLKFLGLVTSYVLARGRSQVPTVQLRPLGTCGASTLFWHSFLSVLQRRLHPLGMS